MLENEGIPVTVLALESHRPSIVARLKGSGAKKPLLLMAHTDVVNVDPKKWTHPPFSATREGGYVYGRGTVDDKDNAATRLCGSRRRWPGSRTGSPEIRLNETTSAYFERW